jgi:hypothetical protein
MAKTKVTKKCPKRGGGKTATTTLRKQGKKPRRKKSSRHDSEKKEAAPKDGFDVTGTALQTGATQSIGSSEQLALRHNAVGLLVALEEHSELSEPERSALVMALVRSRLDATQRSLAVVGASTPLTDSRRPDAALLFRDLLGTGPGDATLSVDSGSELRALRAMVAALLVGQTQSSAELLRTMEVCAVLAEAVTSN